MGALQGRRGQGALAWLTEQAAADTKSGGDTNVRQLADPTSAVNLNMGTLVGSYATSRACSTSWRTCRDWAACC